MPSMYEMMIGAPPSGPEETAAAAKALRGQNQLGMLGVLSGDKVLSQLGGGMMGQSQARSKGLQQARQKQMVHDRELARQKAIEENWAARQAMDQAQLDERITHNRATEQEALMSAMTDLDEKALPPVTAQKTSREIIKADAVVSSIADSFKDEYGSTVGVGEGTFTNWLGKTPFGSDEAKEQAHWWSEYRRLRELTERNRMFGSALTAPEQKAWKEANISENSPADVIKKSLASMQKVAAADKAQQRRSDSALYKTKWVDSIYDSTLDEDTTAELAYEQDADAATSPANTMKSSQGFTYTVSED